MVKACRIAVMPQATSPKPDLTELDISRAFVGHNTETHPVASVPKSLTPIRKGREVNQIPPSPPSFPMSYEGKNLAEKLTEKQVAFKWTFWFRTPQFVRFCEIGLGDQP
jgi:hypothetical protein